MPPGAPRADQEKHSSFVRSSDRRKARLWRGWTIWNRKLPAKEEVRGSWESFTSSAGTISRAPRQTRQRQFQALALARWQKTAPACGFAAEDFADFAGSCTALFPHDIFCRSPEQRILIFFQCLRRWQISCSASSRRSSAPPQSCERETAARGRSDEFPKNSPGR